MIKHYSAMLISWQWFDKAPPLLIALPLLDDWTRNQEKCYDELVDHLDQSNNSNLPCVWLPVSYQAALVFNTAYSFTWLQAHKTFVANELAYSSENAEPIINHILSTFRTEDYQWQTLSQWISTQPFYQLINPAFYQQETARQVELPPGMYQVATTTIKADGIALILVHFAPIWLGYLSTSGDMPNRLL